MWIIYILSSARQTHNKLASNHKINAWKLSPSLADSLRESADYLI